jgi:UDP-2-acetamido-3-amino-2,3-dideoxy-glucuronate N-acetyltransferase
MVGAGTVVTADVPEYTLVVGNPGVIKGHVCECGHPLKGEKICPVCGKKVKK